MAASSLPAFDPRAVAALRRAARGEDQPAAIRSAARQFEALMLQQL
jgi:flagellar protein FlgJ